MKQGNIGDSADHSMLLKPNVDSFSHAFSGEHGFCVLDTNFSDIKLQKHFWCPRATMLLPFATDGQHRGTNCVLILTGPGPITAYTTRHNPT